MKYIIISRQGLESAILFPEHVNHSDAINCQAVAPISAGFCAVHGGRVTTYGESTSLKLKPRPEDAAVITVNLFFMRLKEPSNAAEDRALVEQYLACPFDVNPTNNP